jgi:hypothetical protein
MSSEGSKFYGLEIANKLKIKKSTVYDAIKRLCVLHLIKEEEGTYPRSYVLTREGSKQVSGFLAGYDEGTGIYDRSHAWKFRVAVEKFPEKMPKGWEEWSIKNWSPSKKIFMLDGLEVEVRKNAERSLTIMFSEIPGPDANKTDDRAYFIAYKVLGMVQEEVKGLVVGPVETLHVTLTGAHHTATNDPYAVRCLQAKASIVGRFHSVDASTGVPETEFDRMSAAENRDACVRYSGFVDRYVAGEVSPENTQTAVAGLGVFLEEQLKPVLEQQIEVGNMHCLNIQKHMAVLDEMSQTMKEIRNALKNG